jgi:gas vesicle protein
VSEAVIGFLGVLVGAIIAGAVALLGEQFALKREREARQAERTQQWQDRRDTFELETLLALQDAVSKMRRAVHADYQRKIELMAEQGAWPVRSVHMLLPDDWVEADDCLIRLHARVFDDELQMLIGQLKPTVGAGGDPAAIGAEVEVVGRLPRSSLDLDSHVLTVREDAGGLLCRGEDRIHAGNLAVVAEGHAEDPVRGVPGHHGQLVEAAAAVALRPDRAMAGVVQVHHACQLLSCRRHDAPTWLTAGSTGARRNLGC